MMRLTDSWIRRVDFRGVSEALSIVSSANCSAYDIEISGNRGHSGVRSQSSSRIFIGKVCDRSRGQAVSPPYTSTGISKTPDSTTPRVCRTPRWGRAVEQHVG